MSGHPTYVLRCDGLTGLGAAGQRPPGAECWVEWRPGYGPVTRHLTDIRAEAGGYGWRHVVVERRGGVSPSLDFCPSCVAGGVMERVVSATRAALTARQRA